VRTRNTDPYSNTNGDPDTNTEFYTLANAYSDAYSHAYRNSNSYAYSGRNSYSDSGAVGHKALPSRPTSPQDIKQWFTPQFDGRTVKARPPGGRKSLEVVPWALLSIRLALFLRVLFFPRTTFCGLCGFRVRSRRQGLGSGILCF
jgi:hypothetical protein